MTKKAIEYLAPWIDVTLSHFWQTLFLSLLQSIIIIWCSLDLVNVNARTKALEESCCIDIRIITMHTADITLIKGVLLIFFQFGTKVQMTTQNFF